ncbi:nucleoporin Nup186/Nup192/Nup205 [Podospora conica]|nr:nucleoporin Nup186/Nup192/Nup205 [Schizothecium conicum]
MTSDLRPLEALQALHGELLAVCQHRLEGLATLESLLAENQRAFRRFLDKKARNNDSRAKLKPGKITIPSDDGTGDDEPYEVNAEFVDDTLKVAEELDLDELEAARLLLDASAEGDVESWGRSLWVCGVMRFHQERRFLLDCMRLMVEVAGDDELEENLQDAFGALVEEHVFRVPRPGGAAPPKEDRIVPKCMAAMQAVRTSLFKIADRGAARGMLAPQANMLTKADGEQMEAFDFARVSLIEQHELLAVILCAAVDKRHAEVADFKAFVGMLKKADRYDHFMIHLFPVLGSFITVFGSSEGIGDLKVSRDLNTFLCKPSEDDSWTLQAMRATVLTWWIAEYSGWYLDDTAGLNDPSINLDEEDDDRTKQFLESLKDGAFDLILSVATDTKIQEWQDPSKLGMREWLQRKTPPLPSDFHYFFSAPFQKCMMVHLEVLIDAAISNLPDILRRLRTEEDEQRQLSQTHEQDLNLERFLIIIAHAYEGRPDAAMSFWEDPESNLAGFLQWASRRASTPLVSAFCEMLQALSGNDECATAAHMFLSDEGHHSSGKMKRTQSLTWAQIFKELEFFVGKLRERSSPAQTQLHRPGKPTSDQAEAEPESALMVECYLLLISKLCAESETARQRLILGPENLVEMLFRLASNPIPHRVRSCVFYAFKAMLSRKSEPESDVMFRFFDGWLNGAYDNQIAARALSAPNQSADTVMSVVLDEFSNGFEEPHALVQFLTALFMPTAEYEGLNDGLPFPEDLGSHTRQPGVEIYVDFVLGHIFANKSKEITDPLQLRMIRRSCLEFALTCLATFNEDLIVLGNQSPSISIDDAITASSLANYVRLHPFARVMEWMFNEKVIVALINTIHQDSTTLSMASPDSPLIESILRGVEVILKVLDLQATYLDLVRPQLPPRPKTRPPVANAAFSCFEDGIMNHLTLVVDLGRLCGLQNPPLTLACLKLLERISTSSRIISAWNPGVGQLGHRNKAIVQLEKNGENETIAGTLAGEMMGSLDPVLEAEAPNYSIKIFILDFLYECLKATPGKPTIAHLLLGFHCELNALTVEPRGAFHSQKSLFHNILNILITLDVYQEDRGGVRGYLIGLRYRMLRILQVLWNSPLSARLVMEELRETNFLFHMLCHEAQVQPGLAWDGMSMANPEFPVSDAAVAYINFLGTRAMLFEYIGKELCSVTQKRLPTVKRQIFDALNGQVNGEGTASIPNVFDFFDFLSLDGPWNIPAPEFVLIKDLDFNACTYEDADAGRLYDAGKMREVLALKRNEARHAGQIAPPEHVAAMDREEALLVEYANFSNKQKLYNASRLKVLRAWTNLVLVMFEANDFKGSPKMAFLLQALQAILPSLEAYSALSADEAYELARIAKVLLFKLDLDTTTADQDDSKETMTIGNLISDKLFQLFQICLDSIGKWAGSPALRALYYTICYRYLTAVVDKTTTASTTSPGQQRNAPALVRHRTLHAVQAHGERLLNVICDDAYGSDPLCQTAAMVLLSALVHTSRAADDDPHVVDALNRLNFVGVLVDSLRTVLADDADATEHYGAAKLALVLQLCQTRAGAKHVVQAGLFRALEASGVFAADPELEIGAGDVRGLERHYGLLVTLARIVGAAVVARGAHNVVQGRRFLVQHRGLVVHAMKRSAGIGAVGSGGGNGGGSVWGGGRDSLLGGGGDEEARARLEERIEELAEAFMLLITATSFLEFENEQIPVDKPRVGTMLFH